jgi:hypothetical protein
MIRRLESHHEDLHYDGGRSNILESSLSTQLTASESDYDDDDKDEEGSMFSLDCSEMRMIRNTVLSAGHSTEK